MTISFDKSMFSRHAILRACYALAQYGSFEVNAEHERIVVTCAASPTLDRLEIESALKTAAIDFSVREDVEKKTNGLRDLIWRTAFGEAAGTSVK